MQNAAADSPRLRPALAGLALALAAVATPAAAEEAGPLAPGGFPPLLLAEEARQIRAERWSVWPTVIELRLRHGEVTAPLGLAVRLAKGLSLGAAASFDARRDEAIGFVALELAF